MISLWSPPISAAFVLRSSTGRLISNSNLQLEADCSRILWTWFPRGVFQNIQDNGDPTTSSLLPLFLRLQRHNWIWSLSWHKVVNFTDWFDFSDRNLEKCTLILAVCNVLEMSGTKKSKQWYSASQLIAYIRLVRHHDRWRFFSCPGQLNRWPCHSLCDWLTDWLTF